MVTGGSGFLGRQVVPRLVAAGYAVSALSRRSRSGELLESMGAAPIFGDLDEPERVSTAFKSVEGAYLVNLASLGFGHAPLIIGAAEEAGLHRAILVSTTGIFTTLRPESKAVRLDAEEAIRASTLDWTIVRPTMIYGRPGDRNLERLIGLIRRSPAVPLPAGGRRLQQPVHVDDLATAIVRCLDHLRAIGRSYDLAGPEPLTLRELIGTTAKEMGRRIVLIPVPLRPAVVAARLYERVSRRPRLKAEQLERLGEDKAFDITAAREDLGYMPRSFADGIRSEISLVI